MKTIKLLSVVFIIIFMIIVSGCSDIKGNNKIIQEFNNHIIELPSNNTPLEYPDAFLNSLLDWNSYAVIGLGEGAHGIKNFFELKHRLFKYLVENNNFKVLAYEFSFRTSLKIDKYVTKGIGDLDSLFAGDLWIQDNYEVQDLIKWMRTYNLDKKESEKIHFVGIDNQLDAFYPERTIECIKDYFPEIIQLNNALTQKILELEHIRYKKITTPEYERRRDLYMELLNAANNYFTEKQEYLETLDSKITIHLIESLLNSNQWLYNIYTGGENNRDFEMAHNALWVKDVYNSKVAVWAHTSHVQSNPSFYKTGGSMGHYLRKSLKEEYFIVSTSFTKGEFKAVMTGPDGKDTSPLDCEIIMDPPSESINEVFHQAKFKNFFLNVNKIKSDSQLYSYFDTVRSFLGVGDWFQGSAEFHYSSSERKINLINTTDLVFYFSDTSPVSVHERFKDLK